MVRSQYILHRYIFIGIQSQHDIRNHIIVSIPTEELTSSMQLDLKINTKF